MALTIITGRADNGNEFLCLTCLYGTERSGQQTEREVFCSHMAIGVGNERVSFPVTRCTGFTNRSLEKEGKVYEQYRRQAYYIDASDERSGSLVILPPDKAKARGLWYDSNG